VFILTLKNIFCEIIKIITLGEILRDHCTSGLSVVSRDSQDCRDIFFFTFIKHKEKKASEALNLTANVIVNMTKNQSFTSQILTEMSVKFTNTFDKHNSKSN
jgi:hypothetical protein